MKIFPSSWERDNTEKNNRDRFARCMNIKSNCIQNKFPQKDNNNTFLQRKCFTLK